MPKNNKLEWPPEKTVRHEIPEVIKEYIEIPLEKDRTIGDRD